MKTILKRVFTVVLSLAIVITAIPMMEAKAEETQEILLDCHWLDPEEGLSYKSTKVEVPVGITYGELKELLPRIASTENSTFLGWKGYYEDTEVVASKRAVFNASYDKYPVTVVRAYVDANNNVKTEKFTEYYPEGTTFDVIHEKYMVDLDDMTEDSNYVFTKWNPSVYEAEKVGLNKTYCEIFADYENHNIMKLSSSYVADCGDYGVPVTESTFVVVDKYLATPQYETQLQAYYEQYYAPKNHYAPLEFINWEWWNGDNWDAEEENDAEWALFKAEYGKAQLVLETADESKVYAVEPGQVISLPTEIEGCPVTWDCSEDRVTYVGNYTVPSDVDGSDEIILTGMQEVSILKYQYTETGRWENSTEVIEIEAGSSIDEIMSHLTPGKDVAGLTFEGWSYEGDLEGIYPSVKAIYNKNIVSVYSEYLDEEGAIASEAKTIFLDKEATYKDVLEELNDAKDVIGCSFVEWKLDDEDISIDDTIDRDYVSFYAAYDKYPVHIQKVYIDNDGVLKNEESVVLYNAGTSLESIYNENKGVPADALNGSAEWFEPYFKGEVSLYNNYLEFIAKYKDKVIVRFEHDYTADAGEYGIVKYAPEYVVLDNETCLSEEKLKDYFLNTFVPDSNLKHFKKLSFIDWNFAEFINVREDDYIDYLYIIAEYDTSNVIVLKGWLNFAYEEYVWVVDAGQTIALPYIYGDSYLSWYGDDNKLITDDIYTVPATVQKGEYYYIYAKKAGQISMQNDAEASFEDTNKVLPEATTITTTEVKSGSVYEDAKTLIDNHMKDIKNMSVFEINLYDKDGVRLEQLNGKISLTVKVPFDVTDGKMLKVFRVDGDKLVECVVQSVEDNFCTFETDHFSTYVFVEQKAVPNTGDTTNVLPYMTLLLLGAGVFMVGNKRRNFVR